MPKTVIQIEQLWKQYRLGVIGHGTLYRDLQSWWARKRGREDPNAKIGAGTGVQQERVEGDRFYALRDVSLSVEQGDTVGIIGRNGAGKSTLLKILSHVTTPTKGIVKVRGRIASLLEVGTGFHQELTGRENIFLNGAILGMSKQEIRKRLDEIVAFAEIEEFLDTPVKRYSSGMYVRLAFAVAAHLDPEILIVDEVLAVGDAQFVKKCLGKMSDVSKEGRTVLFVSHNMTTITRLCDRGICLHEGKIIMDDTAPKVVHKYLSSEYGTTAYRKWELKGAPGNDIARLIEVQVNNGNNERTEAVDITKELNVLMKYSVLKDASLVRPFFLFYNEEGVCLFTSTDFFSASYGKPKKKGIYVSKMIVPGNFLAEGNIVVCAGMGTGSGDGFIFFIEDSVLSFTVVDAMTGSSARRDNPGAYPGVIRPILEWNTYQYEQ